MLPTMLPTMQKYKLWEDLNTGPLDHTCIVIGLSTTNIADDENQIILN